MTTTFNRRFRPFTAWLAVVALLFQLALPVGGLVADGLAAGVVRDAAVLCSDHGGAVAPTDRAAGNDCPYCAASACVAAPSLAPEALILPLPPAVAMGLALSADRRSAAFPPGHARARAPPLSA